MDIAKAILDHVDADERQKALANAFEEAPHEHALAPMLAQINIPRDAKADLWNAKRQSMHDPKIDPFGSDCGSAQKYPRNRGIASQCHQTFDDRR